LAYDKVKEFDFLHKAAPRNYGVICGGLGLMV
jgi:hypothetical protein